MSAATTAPAEARSGRARLVERIRRHPWALTWAIAGAAVAALHLAGLGTVPPGLYNDEASIGYNAWTIAHYGVDEHGHRLPLYFEAFGEYKNPLYIYLLAPFTLVLPLTPAVERLPAALCGLGTITFVALAAWTLTRRQPVALAAMLTAAVVPWLTLQSRVGFELPVMTLTLTGALWCYARGTQPGAGRRWLVATGVLLALSVYGYSTGRAYVAGLVVVMLVVDRRWRGRRMIPLLAPVLAAYALLGLYALLNPGKLTGRFNVLSIAADSPGVITEAERLVRNLLTYWGVPFLFTNGDTNLRHNTGYGGMLLVVTLPLVVLGIWACIRRAREPVPRLLLAMLVIGAAPAAVTAEGTPHALRATTMLPPLLLMIALGWAELLPLLSGRRLLAGVVAVALAADAGGFLWDLDVRYPGRALTWFDTGELNAIVVAHDLAGPDHRVYVSGRLDEPYIQVLFGLTPPPVSLPWPDNQAPAMAQVGVSVLPSADDMAATAQPGDLLVLAPDEQAPQGSTLVDTEQVSVAPESVTLPPELFGLPPAQPVVLVRVFRR